MYFSLRTLSKLMSPNVFECEQWPNVPTRRYDRECKTWYTYKLLKKNMPVILHDQTTRNFYFSHYQTHNSPHLTLDKMHI